MKRKKLLTVKSDDGCKYPLWADDEAPTMEFYGEPIMTTTRNGERIRSSYCAKHHHIRYVAPSRLDRRLERIA